MKKLLLFLLLIPALLTGQTAYFNTNNAIYPGAGEIYNLAVVGPTIMIVPKSSTNAVGFVCITPDGYAANKSYPLAVFLHGAGGCGGGTQETLSNLVYGALKDGSNPALGRWDPELIKYLQAECNAYGIVLIAPQAASVWYASDVDHVYNWAIANLNIDKKRTMITGLSLGGGGTLRYITSSKAAADKFACAAICCPVAWGTTWQHIVDAKLPTWFFHNEYDNIVGVGSTNDAVVKINALSPYIPAVKTIYNQNGHGAWNEMYGHAAPTTTNGYGLTNAACNIYDWFLSMTVDSPKAVPVVATIPVPIGLVANAGRDTTISTDTYIVDGTKSSGYKSATWSCTSVPAGVNIYAVNGCGWITCTVKLPKPGTYAFKLTVRDAAGAASSDDVVINYTTTTTPPTFKATHRIFRADGSSEDVRIEGL